MKFTKETFIVGFALFALFFGAGNLILPPYLGFFAGENWYLVAAGFLLSAVGLPLLGIFAHARIQGNLFDFGKKVSPTFSIVFCVLIYAISVLLPSPRTAAVTHEIAVLPFFGVSSLTTSIVYFSLVFLFVIRRSGIISVIGKFLTPAILLLLLAIIISGIFSGLSPSEETFAEGPVLFGFFEGYQTFDAIAALVVGGVIIISIKLKGYSEQREIRSLISGAAVIAGCGLLLVYAGLIYSGAIVFLEFPEDITRTQLLSEISFLSLGPVAQVSLAILVALACFTTAVGITAGTADFMAEITSNKHVYPVTVVLACLTGMFMGGYTVNAIIVIAIPVLMLIYPVTIVLILLNVLPWRYRTRLIMRAVVVATVLFSIPAALGSSVQFEAIADIREWIPLSAEGLDWLLPAFVAFLFAVLFQEVKPEYKKP